MIDFDWIVIGVALFIIFVVLALGIDAIKRSKNAGATNTKGVENNFGKWSWYLSGLDIILLGAVFSRIFGDTATIFMLIMRMFILSLAATAFFSFKAAKQNGLYYLKAIVEIIWVLGYGSIALLGACAWCA